jgi:7-cyano-7-deazaguanine synthase in queuosine biosynthesis
MNANKPITTLLHLSGGQDSTYVAYKWLKEHPNETLLLHHVNLKHRAENRLIVEKAAVQNILKYFKKIGLDNFIYKESSFDYGDLPRISIKDIQIVSLFSSIILKTPKYESIDTLLLSWHKGEVDREDIKKGFRVKKMLEALEVGRNIKLSFPIEFMTRKEMFDDTPKELTKYMWSCRKPRNGSHCGVCKTCIELKEEGIFKYFK